MPTNSFGFTTNTDPTFSLPVVSSPTFVYPTTITTTFSSTPTTSTTPAYPSVIAVVPPIIPVTTNTKPTLTAFAGAVGSGNEDSEIAISFADLINKGNEADPYGQVTGFVVKSVNSGTLRIGLSAAFAIPWNATLNNVIDATHQAYWTPGANANGVLGAFSVVAKDNSGATSATPIATVVNVVAVNDAPVLVKPAAITLVDTPVYDNFATIKGTLVASDVDTPLLSFGINGGTDNGNGTVSKFDTYGTLTVNQSTGAYSFAPNEATIEPLTFDAATSFNLTVSDGTLTDSKLLAIKIIQSGTTESVGNDSLVGTNGNDTIDGLAGADTMVGGLGNDVYYVDNIGDVVVETSTLTTEIDTVNSSVTYSLSPFSYNSTPSNIENLTLIGTSAINGTGNELNNVLLGNSADNILDGVSGNDTLMGYAGNDVLIGGAGNDVLTGGAGNDVFDLTGSDVNSTENITDWGVGTDSLKGLLTIGDQLNVWIDNSSTTAFSAATAAASNGIVSVIGGTGNDNITGGASTDTLIGNAGNDTLAGAGGNDTLVGGSGKDTFDMTGFSVNSTDTIIDWGLGSDSLTGTLAAGGQLNVTIDNSSKTAFSAAVAAATNGVVSVTGGNADDTIVGGSGADTLLGNGGDDSLRGGAGNDIFSGGIGNDTFNLAGSNANSTDTITDWGLGTDVLTGTLAVNGQLNVTISNASVLPFSAAVAAASNGKVSVTGGAANDTITGGIGADTLIGNNGNDILTGGAGNDVLTGGAGDDTFDLTGSNINSTDTITDWGFGSDVLVGTLAAGGQLNVTINDSSTLVFSAATVAGTNGVVSVTGGNANDTITGGIGADTLIGGAGNDVLIGGAGNDNLTGGLGNDTFDLAGANINSTDTITDWGVGSDSLIGVLAAGGRLNVTLDNASATAFSAATAAASNGVVSVAGGNANDTITGGAGADTLTGNAGDDSLIGAGGNDSLTGGSGNDTFDLTGSAINSTDTITDWGVGSDILAGTLAAGGQLNVTIDNASSTIFSAATAALSNGVVSVTGGNANDTITGGSGADTLLGNGGNDRLIAGAGNDSLNGGAGNDTLNGGADDDVLIGGVGRDVLSGGSGVNIYRYLSTADGSTTAGSGDTMATADFVTAVDSLQFVNAGFGSLGAGSLIAAADTGFNSNQATTLTDLGSQADSEVYRATFTGSTFNGAFYNALDAAMTAGSGSGAAFFILTNGTNEVVLYDPNTAVTTANSIVELVTITGGSTLTVATTDLLIV